jgi:2,5-furandicarboxylate decarboxylase 1
VAFGSEDIPQELQGISAKMGLDATRPVKYSGHVFTKVKIPGEDLDPTPFLQEGAIESTRRFLVG